LVALVRRRLHEGSIAVAVIQIFSGGHPDFILVSHLRDALRHHHQLFWISIREGSQKDRIHEAVDGRVRANPQSEREHHHDCEAGVVPKLARSVA